jgi:hypothetical protein
MQDTVALGMALYVARVVEGPIEWRIDGKLVRLNVQAEPAALAAQSNGMIGYAARACGVTDEGFVARVKGFRAILGVEVDASLDPERAIARVWTLARELDALVFLRGTFFDAEGRVLAAPTAPAAPIIDEGEVEAPGPPSPERVVDRLRVLAALAARGLLEAWSDADRTAGLARLEALRAWIVASGIERELESEERDLLFEPTLGALGERYTLDASWRIEGAAVLAWSLSAIPLPSHDRVIDVRSLMDAAGVLGALPPALAKPSLKDADEIFAMRERLFSIHWRLTDFRLQARAMDFAAVATRSTFGLRTDAAMLVGGDLSIGGVPIASADPGAVQRVRSIARERHQAANWLVGDAYGAAYSSVGTDT